ncbi:hypothetical protein N9Y18_07475 [Litoricolaceae bacterium]|nr:hypothetical protein [Litorivicinaceae bacterium]
MTESTNQVSNQNAANIRKNKRRIFDVECEVSTAYAELMLLVADIEENRALLTRNFTSAFNGNRAIAIDNVEDLYRCRMLMVDALDAETEPDQNFKNAMTNSLRIDLLENRHVLNEKLREIASQMAEVNVLMTSLNQIVADANETIADQGAEMVSENAEWIDGELEKMFKAASPANNVKIVESNTERVISLAEKAHIAEQQAQAMVERVGSETKSILDTGDDIAARRERIQADREKVLANQRRSGDLMSK